MAAAYDTAVLADSPQGYWKLDERENLLLWSEDFSNAAWTQPSGSVTVGTTTDKAPDGVGHPQSVVFTSGSVLRQTGITIAAGAVTFSIWARSTTGAGQITVNVRGVAMTFTVTTDLRRYDLALTHSAANGNLDISGTAGVSFRLWGALLTYGSAPAGYIKATSSMQNGGFLDSSGNARHLSRAAAGNGGAAFTMGVSGPDYSDYALDFAGNATPPQITNANTIWNRTTAQALSVEFWLKPRFPGSWSEIIWNNNATNQYNWGVRQDGDAGAPLGTFNGYNGNIATYKPPDNEWHHYVVSFDGANGTIYRDGVIIYGPSSTVAWIGQNTTPSSLNIGAIRGDASVTTQLYRGGLALVAVYGTALTQTQVQNHYNAMKTSTLDLASGTPVVAINPTLPVLAADFARPTGQVNPGANIAVVKAGDAGIAIVKPPDASAPAGFSVVPSGNNISLSWNRNAQAASYRVYRATSQTGPFTLLATQTGITYTDSTVVVGKTYWYAVSSLGNGESPLSAAVPAAILVAPTIANISPAPGTPIQSTTPIAFDVIVPDGARLAIIVANFNGATEVIHDGTSFDLRYVALSQRNQIANGYHYVVSRIGGWPSTPIITPYVVDTAGLEN